MAWTFVTLLLAFSQLVFGNPAAVQRRAGCNADNCPRQLQHSRAMARPFCSSYLSGAPVNTQTITVTTTIPAYSDSPLTFYQRRSAADEALVARTTTSFSPSACTEALTAISSGCSCLLGTTVTSTATATAALPSQCNATNHYGLNMDGFSIYRGGVALFEFGESVKGSCCARCFDTPDCIVYSEYDLQDGSGKVNCDIYKIDSATTTLNPTQTCAQPVTVVPYTPTSTAYNGVGPCGKYVL